MRWKKVASAVALLVCAVSAYLMFRSSGTVADLFYGLVCGFSFAMFITFAAGGIWQDRALRRQRTVSIAPK